MVIALITLAVVGAVVAVNIVVCRQHRDGEWHVCESVTRAPVMRRCVEGRWEYRPMTESESADYQSSIAW